jgi:hypothetical protein
VAERALSAALSLYALPFHALHGWLPTESGVAVRQTPSARFLRIDRIVEASLLDVAAALLSSRGAAGTVTVSEAGALAAGAAAAAAPAFHGSLSVVTVSEAPFAPAEHVRVLRPYRRGPDSEYGPSYGFVLAEQALSGGRMRAWVAHEHPARRCCVTLVERLGAVSQSEADGAAHARNTLMLGLPGALATHS